MLERANQYTGPVDFSGKKFNRWTAIVLVRKKSKIFWKCKCDCGVTKIVRLDGLKSGQSKSCGCWNNEMRSINGKKNRTHGMSGHQFYRSWASMFHRCNNPNSTVFKYYGGRGIKICKRWDKFENFKKDMWDTWKPGLTIERQNVNGNYTPKNCIWIPKSAQVYNTSQTVRIKINGVERTLMEWCSRFGLELRIVRKRLWRGWSTERAFEL